MKFKLKWRIIFVGATRRKLRLVRFTILGFVVMSGNARAQSVITPAPPSVSTTPPAIEALGPGEMQVFPPNNAGANLMDELHPLQWGPVTLRPHLSYQFTYGTGIRYSTNQPPANTIIQTFSPGVLFGLGEHWTLDYTPSFTFYSDKNFSDTLGHAVILRGSTAFADWLLGFSQSFTYSKSPQVETGTQTGEQNYNTGLTASYALNSKVSVDLGISQDLDFPSGYQSTKEWSTMDWVNYEFWPRLVVGAGAGVGYTVATPNSVNEQFQGRINWRATDKISFVVSGGAEFRQFTDGGETPLVNPIYNVSIQYQPFEHTQISFGASQAINTSYYQNQVSEDTSISAGLSQRLFQRYTLSVSGQYYWTTYLGAATGTTVNSPIDNYSATVSLGTTILKRGTVSIFYTYGQTITDQVGLAYVSNQVGINLGYVF